MDRGKEKVNEGKSEKGSELELKIMVGKLRNGILVGKKEGNCTTPSPTWDFGLIQPDGSLVQDFNFCGKVNSVSARKLGANLWEVQRLSKFGVGKMGKNKVGLDHHDQELRDSRVSKQFAGVVPDEGPSEMKSGINTRKKVPASLLQHKQRLKNVSQAQQPLSPTSYSSTVEIPRHRSVISPNNLLGSKGKFRESNYGLKTSTELLKVLNRIWDLEEKHTLDMSLVKMLRRELDLSQARIKELLRDKERDEKKINYLMKQIAEDKGTRKNEEHDRIRDTVKLARKELEAERELRRYLENLCHKLAQEHSDMKSSFADASRELERERIARRLREDLCDEFARGVKEYEEEVRFLKHKSGEDQFGTENKNSLILHMSEAWLDERVQMKLADARKIAESPSVVNKLSLEIETFLRAKQSKMFEKNEHLCQEIPRESNLPVHSLESLHFNEPGSGPYWNDGDDSVGTAIYNSGISREISMQQGGLTRHTEKASDSHLKETRFKPMKKKSESQSAVEGLNKPSPLTQLEEHVEDNTIQPFSIESRKSSIVNEDEEKTGPRSSEIPELRYDIEGSFDPSTFNGPHTPMKKWTSKVAAANTDIYGSSSTGPESIKPDSLKAKLLEARLESQQYRARTSEGLSQVLHL